MSTQPSYGEVHGPRIGEMSRRSFMRRMLGVGIGILSLEFLAGTVNFLWPNIRSGLGGILVVGSASDITVNQPEWPNGLPYIYQSKIFVVNVPAAMARVASKAPEVQAPSSLPVADPGTNVGPDVQPIESSVLALYRKCPHLGCQIPQLCDQSEWFECLCHGSKYNVLGEKRAGPAPRGMDRFTVLFEDGVYKINSGELTDGPPIGTATFDNRDTANVKHCAA